MGASLSHQQSSTLLVMKQAAPFAGIASTAHRFFLMPLFSLWQMQLIGMSNGRTSQHLGKDGNVCVHLQLKEDPDSRR